MAEALGVEAGSIALVESCTFACNVAIWGYAWGPGDRLAITTGEHPATIASTRAVARRFGLDVAVCPVCEGTSDEDIVDSVEREVARGARLVVASHVLRATGRVLPVARIASICRERSARLLIDAAQSVGMLPYELPALGADFVAFAAHKWWCGPEGVAGLYVRPEAMESLHPTFVGWRGLDLTAPLPTLDARPDARRYELASASVPLLAGFREAVAAHDRWGPPRERYERLRKLTGALWRGLVDCRDRSLIPPSTVLPDVAPETGIMAVRFPGLCHRTLQLNLEAEGALTRATREPEGLRICVHYLTTADEVERLVGLITHVVRRAPWS
jgi:L-cysteine/cystine lyase